MKQGRLNAAVKQGRLDAPLARVIRRCLHAQRGALCVAALCLLGVIAMDLIAPWPLKIIFDHVLLSHPLPASLLWLQPLLTMGTWLSDKYAVPGEEAVSRDRPSDDDED